MDTLILMLQSILLGIVEGITEFLPVSSTGHMIIFENLIKFQKSNPAYVEMYTYVIQLGAILAVVILYWKKIQSTLVDFFPQKVGYDDSGFRFWFVIGIACIPGTIAQLLLDSIAEKYLFNPISVAITLFVGGILMIIAEKKFRRNKSKKSDLNSLNVTMKQALIIGTFQCLAIIPGMSRSASTIIGGWVAGLSTIAAAEFSFFLAIPVMFGMTFLKLFKIGGFGVLSFDETAALLIGFIISFIVALIVVNKFITYLKKKPMRIFAIYRMLFAIIVLIAGFAGLF